MKSFMSKHQAKISGSISTFDRVIFKGYLPLGWPGAIEGFLFKHGILIKDFKSFVQQHSATVKAHAQHLADAANRPWIRLQDGHLRKEEYARKIAERDGVTEGLVCILSAVEATQSFRVCPGEGRPRIFPAPRKCLCLYFYYIDPDLGWLHVRLPTWFPFPIQFCIHGHEVLACTLQKEGIAFEKVANSFVQIGDVDRAQQMADQFTQLPWPRLLDHYAQRVNPLMKTILHELDYYYVIDQAEFATDIIFRAPSTLTGLYNNLLRHALTSFGAEDVMTFLGRKLTPQFQGELGTVYKQRWPGARIKHRMKGNWIKMYNKHGCVLRVETVINHPYEFKVRRQGKRQGRVVTGWFPMAKGLANIHRYAEVSMAANERYLEALSVVNDPGELREVLLPLAKPVRRHQRSYRAFNPLNQDDMALFAAVLRGEHALNGFANHHIREALYAEPKGKQQERQQAARVSRLLKRLHMHGLIGKIPRTRRWRVTAKGQRLMATCLSVHQHDYPDHWEQHVA